MLEAAGKYLEIQGLRVDANILPSHQFPDFDVWKQTHPSLGVCLKYVSPNREYSHGLCQGEELGDKRWPAIFERCYRKLFNPGTELTRKLVFHGKNYGTLAVTPSADSELAKAWDSLTQLLGLSALTTLAVCVLVYYAIYLALRPGAFIVDSLHIMQADNAEYLLPPFKLMEWRQIGSAINQFVNTQKTLFAERQNLISKMMRVQEDERRYLARELHDELGQCLAAVKAICASLKQSAEADCPKLVPEIEQLAKVNKHTMETVRLLLTRLRPAELADLGLESCLRAMVAEWNRQQAGKNHCRLVIHGNCARLREPLPIVLYRIVQECLTNISKHSSATQSAVTLEATASLVSLVVQDNGNAAALPLAESKGMGLAGIRERVASLDGRMMLALGDTGGFIVKIALPLPDKVEYPA